MEKCFDLALRKGKAIGEMKPTETNVFLGTHHSSNIFLVFSPHSVGSDWGCV